MNINDIIENAQLKGRIIALDAEVQTLTAEVRCLEAVIRSHERDDSLIVANLKAEVERLTIQGGDSEPRSVLLSEYQHIKALLAFATTKYCRLEAEVERLRKAGDAMAFNYESMCNAVSVYDCDLMKYVDAWNAAKEGKQS